ncbi:MAG: DinB family protein [Pyrinomonadaceae bacterium]
MSETERIADQLKRAFEGEAWHGPSVMELVGNITVEQASARPFPSSHSIWEIVLHIAAWERACLRRLHGDRAQLSADEDWPLVVNAQDGGWQQSKLDLQTAEDELCDAISRLHDSRLDQPIIKRMSTVYVTLHGVVQHSLYHAGQIALLKKIISEGKSV